MFGPALAAGAGRYKAPPLPARNKSGFLGVLNAEIRQADFPLQGISYFQEPAVRSGMVKSIRSYLDPNCSDIMFALIRADS